ncbi:MAG TPA: NUDIX hydrolase [Nocardioides sp.]|uniref:NUDIX hydrolase n=1 Tax=Nocardioides sp. TaxID=35761 RepID=UPI002EDB7E2B
MRAWDEDERWRVVDSEDLHRDDWVVALRADMVVPPSDPEHEPFRRLVLEHPGAAVVLAVDDDEQVVCLRQYRHPAGRRFLELPAGLCDADGEDPLEVARRELREEALLAAAEWTHLTSAFSSPGISAEVIHYYLAKGLSEVSRGDFALVHEEADMELLRVPFADLFDAVLAGRVTDAPVIVAVLSAHARGLVGVAR